jgi:hypothetical protein
MADGALVRQLPVWFRDAILNDPHSNVPDDQPLERRLWEGILDLSQSSIHGRMKTGREERK